MDTKSNSIALIYARVSTKKQDPMSQLIRCKEYCKQKGYQIEKCFKDKFTGGGNFLERPAMRELLEYAKKNLHKQYIVVFDDLKRFARDTKFHIELRTTFKANGLTPECLNYNFDDSPEGRFMETMFAAQNELERHQNRRQVIQKQRARLIAGYNAFVAPTGYKKIRKDPLHGTIDVPNQYAPIMKKALKGFAYGEFHTRMDVAVFLKSKGVLGKQEPHKYLETVKRFLSNIFYAGYIEYLPWDVKRRKGHHKPLISLKEYDLIQSRLQKTNHVKPIRRDLNPEYPLRGLVNCYHCKEKLTACKSRGRWGGLYHKYYCRNKNCFLRDKQGIKSVSREELHKQFKILLSSYQSSSEMHQLAHQVIDQIVATGKQQQELFLNELHKQQLDMEKEMEVLLCLITNPKTSEVLREQYEKKATKLAEKLKDNKQHIEQNTFVMNDCRTPLAKLFKIFENPYKIWTLSDVTQKQHFFYFLFEANLEYQPEVGFRTPKKSLLIRLFEQFANTDSVDVKTLSKTSNPLRGYLLKYDTEIRAIIHLINQ